MFDQISQSKNNNNNAIYREETEVDEFLISGDHDHYITSETIVLPNDAVAYEEISEEPKAKKRKLQIF